MAATARMSSTDEALVRDLRAGHPTALDRSFRTWSDRVYAYATTILGRSDAAEDVVQETFLRLQRSIHTLRSDEAFLPWLFRVARNECLMHLRRSRSNGVLDTDAVLDEPSPHEQLVERETTDILRSLLHRMRPAYREVLLLREYEDLSYEEIARLTGTTESSVKSRIFRAREALSKAMRSTT